MTTAIASAGQPLVNSYCATGARDDEALVADGHLVQCLAQHADADQRQGLRTRSLTQLLAALLGDGSHLACEVRGEDRVHVVPADLLDGLRRYVASADSTVPRPAAVCLSPREAEARSPRPSTARPAPLTSTRSFCPHSGMTCVTQPPACSERGIETRVTRCRRASRLRPPRAGANLSRVGVAVPARRAGSTSAMTGSADAPSAAAHWSPLRTRSSPISSTSVVWSEQNGKR